MSGLRHKTINLTLSMDSQQNVPTPTNQLPKALTWVVIVVIVLVLGVGGYLLLKNSNSTASNTNTAVGFNANTNIASNAGLTNNEIITNGSVAGWRLYKNTNPAFQFDFPSYLKQQENYANRLVQSVVNTGAIESIKLGTITKEEIAASKSTEEFVDGISIEFSGTFKELAKANQVKYGSNQLVEKSYSYHSTIGENGAYTRKVTLLMSPIAGTSDYLLMQVFGTNTQAFDQAVEQIATSISS